MAKEKKSTANVDSIEDRVKALFSNLKTGDLEITSDRDHGYNCIAWAMGEWEQFWWPDEDSFWPEEAPRQVTVEAFTAAFATKGFKPCLTGKLETGKEKVALYTKHGKPTHASFLSPCGRWASKLGRFHDILHRDLQCIGGGEYGEATHYFERIAPAEPRPAMPNTEYEFAKQYGVTNEALGRLKGRQAPSKRKA